jgi:hypothetical protein
VNAGISPVEGPQSDERFFVAAYSIGLGFASVCTNLDDDAATDRLNLQHPTGVQPWHVHGEPFADGSPNPSPCPDREQCRHILFSC